VYKVKFSQDDHWLAWFIGFLEGDGAILEHKGRCSMVLTQKDNTVLHEIAQTFKFGRVKDFYLTSNLSGGPIGSIKYSRYVVANHQNIYLFYLLLNGNLALEARRNQLIKWNIALNNAIRFDFTSVLTKFIPEVSNNLFSPTLNDAWLSGFTDAEGCFSVKIGNKKDSRVSQRWSRLRPAIAFTATQSSRRSAGAADITMSAAPNSSPSG
jgi:hypothetical protein